jgi:hypothetical protein
VWTRTSSSNELDAGVLAKLIEGSGIPFKPGKQSYIFDCPRCGKKQKLYIRRRDGRFKCFYCAEIDGFQGRAEFALRELLGLSIQDLQFKLYGIGIHSDGAHLDLELKDFWDDEDEAPAANDDPMEPVVFPTTTTRSTMPSRRRASRTWRVAGCPSTCAAVRRALQPHPAPGGVPARDERRAVRLAGAHHPAETEWYDDAGTKFSIPKIVTSTGAPRDRLLMFYDRTQGPGTPDRHRGAGGRDEVPPPGLERTDDGQGGVVAQARLIMEHPGRDVYLALDPDAAEETARLVRDLGEDKRVYLLEPARGYKDLGEMSMEGVVEQFHGAQRVTAGHLFLYFNFGARRSPRAPRRPGGVQVAAAVQQPDWHFACSMTSFFSASRRASGSMKRGSRCATSESTAYGRRDRVPQVLVQAGHGRAPLLLHELLLTSRSRIFLRRGLSARCSLTVRSRRYEWSSSSRRSDRSSPASPFSARDRDAQRLVVREHVGLLPAPLLDRVAVAAA